MGSTGLESFGLAEIAFLLMYVLGTGLRIAAVIDVWALFVATDHGAQGPGPAQSIRETG